MTPSGPEFQHAQHDARLVQVRNEGHDLRAAARAGSEHDLERDFRGVLEADDGEHSGPHGGTGLVEALLVVHIDEDALPVGQLQARGEQLARMAVEIVNADVASIAGLGDARIVEGHPLDAVPALADGLIGSPVGNHGFNLVLDGCGHKLGNLAAVTATKIDPRCRHVKTPYLMDQE